jgi:hypothetical protein
MSVDRVVPVASTRSLLQERSVALLFVEPLMVLFSAVDLGYWSCVNANIAASLPNCVELLLCDLLLLLRVPTIRMGPSVSVWP